MRLWVVGDGLLPNMNPHPEDADDYVIGGIQRIVCSMGSLP